MSISNHTEAGSSYLKLRRPGRLAGGDSESVVVPVEIHAGPDV